MVDDVNTAALLTQLETIVKEAEVTKDKAATGRHHIQAARLFLEEEETKATALE
jgi:beta-galactosidase beta subunit